MPARDLPLYARLLGLQYLAPSGFLCFVFLEGAVALGILLALAELVSWWGVLVLPLTVAVMVKLNDVIAGVLSRPAPPLAMPIPVPRPLVRRAAAPPTQIVEHVGVAEEDRSLSRARTVDLRTFDDGRVRGNIYPASPGEGAARGPRLPASRRDADGPQGTVWSSGARADESLATEIIDMGAEHAAPPIGTAVEPGGPQVWGDDPEALLQRARQSAARRYE